MILSKICTPALIYIIFSITQIIIDTFKGHYNVAFVKIWVSIVFTILLNFLCKQGLGIISWFIVFIPFILMTLIVSILLLMFGLDPLTGERRITKNKKYNVDKDAKDTLDLLKRNKKYDDLRFSPYYLNLEKKKNSKHSQDNYEDINEIEDSIIDRLISKLIKIKEDNDTKEYKKPPEPYDKPTNMKDCKKKTNRPSGCPCKFGNNCFSGNCNIDFNICTDKNKDNETQKYNRKAGSSIKLQNDEIYSREKGKKECLEKTNSHLYEWDGVECKLKNY